MAMNFTPLRAYITEEGRNAKAQQRAGQAIGNIAKGVSEIVNKKKSQAFFDSLGDADVKEYDSTIEQIDMQIKQLQDQLAELEAA